MADPTPDAQSSEKDEMHTENKLIENKNKNEGKNIPEKEDEKKTESRFIEVFFHDYWNKYIAKFKWIIIPVVLIWVGI